MPSSGEATVKAPASSGTSILTPPWEMTQRDSSHPRSVTMESTVSDGKITGALRNNSHSHGLSFSEATRVCGQKELRSELERAVSDPRRGREGERGALLGALSVLTLATERVFFFSFSQKSSVGTVTMFPSQALRH